MPRKIILHAGFHKTGTSTVQATLRTNRPALKKHVAMRLRPQMKELIHATRGYSTWRDPLTLTKAQLRFEKMLKELPGMPKRTLIISAEELAGHLPGRGHLDDYSAAPVLLYMMWQSAREIFPDTPFEVYLSTRAPDAWLPSAYWEHVKASSMSMEYADFVARYAKAADLAGMAAEIASRMPCPVHSAALETSVGRYLGPTDLLLDLVDIPHDVRETLVPVPPANTRLPQDVLHALLAANRRYKDRDARSIAKRAILKEAADARGAA